jgi:hypothetical protein
VDFEAVPGQTVTSPTNGTYSRQITMATIDKATGRNHTGVELLIAPNIFVQILYVIPNNFTAGQAIRAGDSIGTAWDIAAYYGGGMTNHVHLEIEDRNFSPKQFIDPSPLIP